MKILITDGLAKEGIKILEDGGFSVDNVKLSAEEIIKEIPSYDALIVRSATKVTRDVIRAGCEGSLKIIGRAGVGYDNVDVKAASEYGILVKCAPHGNTAATAELAMALMLDISRKVSQAYASLKGNVWEKKRFEGKELTGKTLGIVGCGRIGQKLAELVQGFRMDVIGYDPYQANAVGIRRESSLEGLLAEADYVSLHLPAQTVPVIGELQLQQMKETAYLINTSRGENVDEGALYKALSNRQIAGAALDVYDIEGKEGQEYKNPLFGLDNFAGTPHLGASTAEAQKRTGIEMAEAIIGYLEDGDATSAVNIEDEITAEKKPTYPLFVHHIDKPGVFAQIDRILAEEGVNIREIKSSRMGGNANTVYILNSVPGSGAVDEIRKLDDIYRVTYGYD